MVFNNLYFFTILHVQDCDFQMEKKTKENLVLDIELDLKGVVDNDALYKHDQNLIMLLLSKYKICYILLANRIHTCFILSCFLNNFLKSSSQAKCYSRS